MPCRDSATQLALLDRVAGTQAAAAKFGNQLQQAREVEEQLADIATLGDEEERDELQQMIEEVGPGKMLWLTPRYRALNSCSPVKVVKVLNAVHLSPSDSMDYPQELQQMLPSVATYKLPVQQYVMPMNHQESAVHCQRFII